MKEYGRIITLRIPLDLLAEIDEAIASRNVWNMRTPGNWRALRSHDSGRTAWLLRAVKEKLAKLKRGRRPRRRAAGAPSLPLAGAEANP